MAQSKTIHSSEYDSLVIGGGLAGLIVAHQLEGTGRKVALIEGLDALGGSCRPGATKAGVIDHGLKFMPDTVEARETLAWLGTVLDEEIQFEAIEAPPVTFDDGKFKPFVGFGEQKVKSGNEIGMYAQEKYLRLKTTPKDWVPRLAESFAGTLLTQSYVTKMQVDDEFVIEVLINGAKRLSGREVLFCASPQQLVRILPESHIAPRLRQKLSKGELFTSLNLDLVHGSVVTDSQAVHVLKGANEEPAVGIFYPPTSLADGNPVQLSQWMTLVPRDLVDDAETSASALKQIKRQVKRAYETSLDSLKQERIIVNPSSHGDLHGALAENGHWPKLQNLWVVSGLLDTSKNLLGTLRQARRTLASIAGEPIELMVHDTDLSDSPQPSA
jgi:hypothetical protein